MLKHPLSVGTQLRFPSGLEALVEHRSERDAQWIYWLQHSSVPWTQKLLDASGARINAITVPVMPADKEMPGR